MFDAINPSEEQIIYALAKAFSAPPSAAVAWLSAIQRSFNPVLAQERIVEREFRDRERARKLADNSVLLFR